MGVELLKQLVEAHGIAGREERIQPIVIAAMKPLVDEIRIDHLGNVVGHRKGDGRTRAVVMAHMDEIGFLVSHIDAAGFLRVLPVGGWDPRTMMAQRVIVHGRRDLPGVFGIPKPTHILTDEERRKVLQISDYYIDLGLPVETVKAQVQVGDWVTMDQDMIEIGDMYSSKTMDDRVGVYVMLEALRAARSTTADIYVVASTQEEVGLRGAQVSVFGISPTVALALDITLAVDTPGVPESERVTALGAGTAIKIMDSSAISDPKLVDFFRKLATDRKIKHQIEILPRGGTDAGGMQRVGGGVPVITVSIPTRYVHSVVESVHKDDLQASIDLTAAFIEEAQSFAGQAATVEIKQKAPRKLKARSRG